MSTVFDALPGIEVPVGQLSRSLADMWRDPDAQATPGHVVDDATATQANLVLLLGLQTTPEDALAQFAATIEFSKRYPSRVVILCPLPDDSGQQVMRAKVYGECHLGKSRSDKRCVEFAMLSYPLAAKQFLENQVSICLSTDLPLYYWAHGFAHSSRLAEYRYLLTESKRVIIDSARAPAGAMDHPWPRPEAVRDLAYARILPIRQSLGQFLSRYAMDAICGGLRSVTVTHGQGLEAEGRVLLGWFRDRVGKCGTNTADYRLEAGKPQEPGTLSVKFAYDGGRRFQWDGNLRTGRARFAADLGGSPTSIESPVSLLGPSETLSEALFF